MKITVNDKEIEIRDNGTIEDVLQTLGVRSEGVAFAEDDEVISKSEYATKSLTEGAKLFMIRAVCGG